VHSAADVDMSRMQAIRGLGEHVAETVAAWRVDAELAARKSMPTVLPAPELHRLTARFGRERTRILWEEQRSTAQAQRMEMAVALYWSRRRQPIEQRLAVMEAALRTGCTELEAAIADARSRAAPLQVQLARARRELEPFGGLSFGRYVAGAVTGRGSILP
jgi:hypothetical protein